MPGQTLRAKTGCYACKRAKKKCDESTPECRRCQSTKQSCQWPSATELVDRRFISHSSPRERRPRSSIGGSSRRSSPEQTPAHDAATDARVYRSVSEQRLVTAPNTELAGHALARGIEEAVSRHFVEGFYRLILLPECDPSFSRGWLTEIHELIPSCPTLRWSTLACAAAHLHLINDVPWLQHLALTYYSKAITDMLRLLARLDQPIAHDGLLSSIILLSIHGCQGLGTYVDIPRHLQAASSIVDSRVIRPENQNKGLFDILATESILYHMFHASTGLWSDNRQSTYEVDLSFWKRAERQLNDPTLCPGVTNSPVLGVPIPLLRLVLQLCQLYRRTAVPSFAVELDDLQQEVTEWENLLPLWSTCSDVTPEDDSRLVPIRENGRTDANTPLYVLVVSILWTRIANESTGSVLEPTCDNWQISRAVEYLCRYDGDEGFTKSYMGNWPIYTLGFLASRLEDRQVFEENLQKRWRATKMGQIQRFLTDLQRQHMAELDIAAIGT